MVAGRMKSNGIYPVDLGPTGMGLVYYMLKSTYSRYILKAHTLGRSC